MDINTLRMASTVLSLAVFVGILVWAYSSRQSASFEEAAQLPFEGESNHE
ncbi:MAG: cbb3-type cytochrome c oxidase subunit 3 [Burkholderiaceae bacterium]